MGESLNIIPGRLTNLREFVYVSIVVIPNDHWSSGLVLVFASKFILSVVNAIMINDGDRIDHNYKFLYSHLGASSWFSVRYSRNLGLIFDVYDESYKSVLHNGTKHKYQTEK